MITVYKNRDPDIKPGLSLSFFPSLALTRSGSMGIFSDSFSETTPKKENNIND